MESRLVFECLLAQARAMGCKVECREIEYGQEARLSTAEGEATVRYYSKRDHLDIRPGPAGRDLKPRLERQAGEAREVLRRCLPQALSLLGPDLLSFLEPQDSAFALSSLLLLEDGPLLPDYSAVVMPMGKCLEGFATKLLIRLGLADPTAVQAPEWNFGRVWGNAKYEAFVQADREDKKHLERVRAQIPFTRHGSMHSRPGLDSRIATRDAARARVEEICNLMRDSLERFKARV